LLARLGWWRARGRPASSCWCSAATACGAGALAGLLDRRIPGRRIDAHGISTRPNDDRAATWAQALACAVGRGLEDCASTPAGDPVLERNVALIGVRHLDPPEELALVASSVTAVRAETLGADPTELDRALHALGTLPQLYLHVDIDALDPAEAPGVDYPAASGLRLDQLRGIVEQAAGMGNLAALSLTAVNPDKDVDGRTVRAALDVIEAALARAVATA
jgi:arginase